MWIEAVDRDNVCTTATKVDFKRFGGPLQDRVGAAVRGGERLGNTALADVDEVGGSQAVRE